MGSEKTERPTPRREALLEAAAAVFFEQGYAATSIDSIIERSGGSKRNIYDEFGNKEGLFLAIVAQRVNKVLAALAIEYTSERDLRETLTAFGRDLIDLYMSSALIGIYRIVVAEAHRFPVLARSFYEQGPARAAFWLTKVLEGAKKRGEIRTDDPARAAGHFIGMIRDNLHLQVVLGLRPPPSAKEMRKALESAVDVFLDGVRAERDR